MFVSHVLRVSEVSVHWTSVKIHFCCYHDVFIFLVHINSVHICRLLIHMMPYVAVSTSRVVVVSVHNTTHHHPSRYKPLQVTKSPGKCGNKYSQGTFLPDFMLK